VSRPRWPRSEDLIVGSPRSWTGAPPTSRYWLKDLGRATVFHAWGGVDADCHEFIAILRTAGDLAVIAAADE
jgi:hypothetical protein